MILRTLVRRFLLPLLLAAAAGAGTANAQLITPTLTISGVGGDYTPGSPATAFLDVAPNSPVTASGNVSFYVVDTATSTSTFVCAAALVEVLLQDSTASCSFSVPATAGAYALRVDYPGDPFYLPASASVPFGVKFQSIVDTGTSIPIEPQAEGSVIKLAFTVSSPDTSAFPDGSVTVRLRSPFDEVGTPVCSATLVNGVGACDVTLPTAPNNTAVGSYFLSAQYTGSGTFFPNNSGGGFEIGVTVKNNADAGDGSLRDAIAFVNSQFDSSTLSCDLFPAVVDIVFNIPGSAVIKPATALPPLACPGAWVNGYTQPGSTQNTSGFGANNASLQVVLDGSGCTKCDGLALGADNQEVDGLSIINWSNAGVLVDASVFLYGNYIGTDPTGTAAFPNAVGVQVVGGVPYIGSGNDVDSNLITGNTGDGIQILAGTSATVDTNQVGGTRDGGNAIGNGGAGVHVSGVGVDVVRNAVRFNGQGIVVEPGADAAIAGNAAYDNSGPGIDLVDANGALGVTPNDDASAPYDLDTGGNGLQNFPVIDALSRDPVTGIVTVSGHVFTDATTSDVLIVEFYSNTRGRTAITGGDNIVGVSSPLAFDATGANTFTTLLPPGVDNISTTATVLRCGFGLAAPPGDLKSANSHARGSAKAPFAARLKATAIGPCATTSEYSPSVAVPSPQLAPDQTTLTMMALGGTTSTASILTLRNAGNAATTISAVVASGAGFTIATNTCSAGVPAGGSCQVGITFSAPTTPGGTSGQLTITHSATGSPLNINLLGFSYAPLQATLATPANPVAGSTTPLTIDVTNPNPAGMPPFEGVLGSFTVVPTGFTVLSTNAGTCPAGTSNFAVPSQTTCRLYDAILNVANTPGTYTFNGLASANLPFVTPANAPAVTVAVKTGTLTVTPASLSFGSVVIGTVSAPQNVTLVSSTRAPVAITASATSPFGADASGCASGVTNTGCVIIVKFAPAFGGVYSGTLTVTDVAGGGTYTVVLSGIGAPPPAPGVSLTPSSGLSFPSRSINTTSPPSTVTLTNTGNANLTLGGITVTGDFAFVSSCPATLAAGASCLIDVRFTPLVAGTRTGVLSIASNASGSPHLVNLTGQAVAVFSGTLDVFPTSLDFGNQGIGTTSATQTVELFNTGSAAVSLLAVTVSSPFALAPVPAQFAGCPAVLGAGGACVIAISFTPTQVGSVSGSLVISSDATNPRLTVPLGGAGQVAPPARALTVTGRLDFGVQPFGQRSGALTLTLTNVTGQPATIADIEGSGDFTVDEGCATVPARGTCSLNVYFTPSARGARSGSVTITVAGEGQPYVVVLTGDGGANPNPLLGVTPSFIGFGNAIVGPTQETGSVRLANLGEVPVVLGGIGSLGDFLVTSHCGTTIPVGATCTLDIAFYPRLIGLRAATLDIPSNAVNGPHSVGLSGVGCSMPNVARSRIPQLVCTP